MSLPQSNEVTFFNLLAVQLILTNLFFLKSSRSRLAFPFLDESIIANLDNLISVFRDPSRTSELNASVLQNVLGELNVMKQKLTEIRENALGLESSEVSSQNSAELAMMNPLTRSSIEMLKNNGRFTQLINPKIKSENMSLKENLKSSPNRSPSISSLRNSMKVSPVSFTRRKPAVNARMLARKISRLNITKKPEKVPTPPPTPRDPPKIVKTLYASCRIHSYEDNSHTFEIIKPRDANAFGDSSEKSEFVIVVLANGSSALFQNKDSKRLLNLPNIGKKNKA